mmetsp:Transcript_2553/g.9089  ORF Transcript_2553/g.9089 Transcript_2553/m.9089 type:complete len:258 (-) Transcript_2553:39-812(-)
MDRYGARYWHLPAPPAPSAATQPPPCASAVYAESAAGGWGRVQCVDGLEKALRASDARADKQLAAALRREMRGGAGAGGGGAGGSLGGSARKSAHASTHSSEAASTPASVCTYKRPERSGSERSRIQASGGAGPRLSPASGALRPAARGETREGGGRSGGGGADGRTRLSRRREGGGGGASAAGCAAPDSSLSASSRRGAEASQRGQRGEVTRQSSTSPRSVPRQTKLEPLLSGRAQTESTRDSTPPPPPPPLAPPH